MPPAIHEDDLVTEARRFVFALVPAAHGLGKGAGVVDGDGHHLVQLVFLRGCVEVRPQAAQRLRQHRSAVIVSGHAAGIVCHDNEHGYAACILCGRAVDGVKAGEHHFERGLHGQGAGLQIDDGIQHARLLLGQNAVQRRVCGLEAVGGGDEAALQRAGDKAAGVVVRSIGDSETLGVFNKRVAWKVVSQGNLVMLAFAREIQAAVLADAECAQPAQRSCKAVLGGTV